MDKSLIYFIQKMLDKKGWIDLPAHGSSMFPFIQEGDICRFVISEPLNIKKGDIILFQTSKGQIIAHRLYKVTCVDNLLKYQFKGDTNFGLDKPINSNQIMGKLYSVQKNRLTFRAANIPSYAWGRLILSFPLLSSWLRTYLNRKSPL